MHFLIDLACQIWKLDPMFIQSEQLISKYELCLCPLQICYYRIHGLFGYFSSLHYAYSTLILKKKNLWMKMSLPHLTQQRITQMGRKANDEGWEDNLNWPLSVLLIRFYARQTSSTENTAKKDNQ